MSTVSTELKRAIHNGMVHTEYTENNKTAKAYYFKNVPFCGHELHLIPPKPKTDHFYQKSLAKLAYHAHKCAIFILEKAHLATTNKDDINNLYNDSINIQAQNPQFVGNAKVVSAKADLDALENETESSEEQHVEQGKENLDIPADFSNTAGITYQYMHQPTIIVDNHEWDALDRATTHAKNTQPKLDQETTEINVAPVNSAKSALNNISAKVKRIFPASRNQKPAKQEPVQPPVPSELPPVPPRQGRQPLKTDRAEPSPLIDNLGYPVLDNLGNPLFEESDDEEATLTNERATNSTHVDNGSSAEIVIEDASVEEKPLTVSAENPEEIILEEEEIVIEKKEVEVKEVKEVEEPAVEETKKPTEKNASSKSRKTTYNKSGATQYQKSGAPHYQNQSKRNRKANANK